MIHPQESPFLESGEFADLGTEFVAYMREIPGEELAGLLPDTPELEPASTYWVLFAANGEPLMVSDDSSEILSGAFHNDLTALRPN